MFFCCSKEIDVSHHVYDTLGTLTLKGNDMAILKREDVELMLEDAEATLKELQAGELNEVTTELISLTNEQIAELKEMLEAL